MDLGAGPVEKGVRAAKVEPDGVEPHALFRAQPGTVRARWLGAVHRRVGIDRIGPGGGDDGSDPDQPQVG